jgi:hypothetical protein
MIERYIFNMITLKYIHSRQLLNVFYQFVVLFGKIRAELFYRDRGQCLHFDWLVILLITITTVHNPQAPFQLVLLFHQAIIFTSQISRLCLHGSNISKCSSQLYIKRIKSVTYASAQKCMLIYLLLWP